MRFKDFAGMFVVWFATSVASLIWAYVADHKRFQSVSKEWLRKSQVGHDWLRRGGFGKEVPATPTSVVSGGDAENAKPQLSEADVTLDDASSINLDNSSMMLRKVLRDLDSMQTVQREMLASQKEMSRAFEDRNRE